MQRPHLLIIARNRLLREGLRLVIGDAEYSVEDSPSIAAKVDADGHHPDIVLLVVGTSVDALRAEIAAARAAWGSRRPIRLVVLANVAAAAAARRLSALDVDAVLSDDISREVLLRSIELVGLGERLFPRAGTVRVREPAPPRNADILAFPRGGVARNARAPAEPPYDVVLSSREKQILQQLMAGATNKHIARELDIAEATVKVHVKGLLRKIRATNRTQAAIWALHSPSRMAEAPAERLVRGSGRH